MLKQYLAYGLFIGKISIFVWLTTIFMHLVHVILLFITSKQLPEVTLSVMVQKSASPRVKQFSVCIMYFGPINLTYEYAYTDFFFSPTIRVGYTVPRYIFPRAFFSSAT